MASGGLEGLVLLLNIHMLLQHLHGDRMRQAVQINVVLAAWDLLLLDLLLLLNLIHWRAAHLGGGGWHLRAEHLHLADHVVLILQHHLIMLLLER